MLNRIKLAWKVLNTSTLILLTDEISHVEIPTLDPYRFNNVILLSAQQTSLKRILDEIGHIIEEHGKAIERMTNEQGQEAPSEAKHKKKG